MTSRPSKAQHLAAAHMLRSLLEQQVDLYRNVGDPQTSPDVYHYALGHRAAFLSLMAPPIETLQKMTVEECDGCGDNGSHVRTCPLHGLQGVAPR